MAYVDSLDYDDNLETFESLKKNENHDVLIGSDFTEIKGTTLQHGALSFQDPLLLTRH